MHKDTWRVVAVVPFPGTAFTGAVTGVKATVMRKTKDAIVRIYDATSDVALTDDLLVTSSNFMIGEWAAVSAFPTGQAVLEVHAKGASSSGGKLSIGALMLTFY